MTTTTPITPTALTLDEALHAIFPDPKLGLLRLATADDVHEKYFRRVEGQWRGLDEQYSGAGWSGPALFVQQHPGSSIVFTPTLFKAPAPGAHHPLACLWVSLPLKLVAAGAHEPRPRRIAESAQAARERLQAAPVIPTLVIDEGPRITALWRLSEPLDDPIRPHRLLVVLARFFGVSAPTAPSAARIALPGSASAEVFPRHEVHAEGWTLDSTTADALDGAYRMDP